MKVTNILKDSNQAHVVFQNMVDWIVELNEADLLAKRLAILTDHTHNVERLGYSWGMSGVLIWRCLNERWRKTFIPLLLHCAPIEYKGSYVKFKLPLSRPFLHNTAYPP